MHPNIIGALINSALYLLCVFAAGIVTNHPLAWKSAIIAMGITYLSHYTQLIRGMSPIISMALVAWSIALGAIAGILLLF